MSPTSPHPVSPEIRISESEYFTVRQQDDSPGADRGNRARFGEVVHSGLGIRMAPMMPPASPEIITPQLKQDVAYTPLSPPTNRSSLYPQTPGSTTSFGSDFSRGRTDPMTEQLIQQRATQSTQWTIHWRRPTLMVLSFLTGISFAVGQHLLYKSLHHTTEEDEGRKIRLVLYGRALAYLANVAFGGCVVLCYRQRIWRTFRETPLSVWAIDQLFLATEDPSLFINWEIITKASILTAMAMALWIIPVATIIFSPGALTFGDYLEVGNAQVLVPTLNFTAESYKDWRIPVNGTDGTKKKSVIFMNTTDRAGKAAGWFDYYDQPSADLQRISLMSAYNLKGQPLNRDDARLRSCGGDFNCTYVLSFVAPGYDCKLVANGPEDDQKLADLGAPFNTSILAPKGRHVYYAEVDQGGYKHPQPGNLSAAPGGVPIGFIPEDLGVFKMEPTLWLGYSRDSKQPLAPDSPYSSTWKTRFDPRIMACTHCETKYTVQFNYTGPFYATNVSYEFLKPIVDTKYSRYDDGIINHSDPQPVSNFISPRTNVTLYKKTAAYVAIGERLRYFLRGRMQAEPPIPGPDYVVVYSQISVTSLISTASDAPVDDFPRRLQKFYADMILSFFSTPSLLVVSEEHVTVNTTRHRSAFIYRPWKLWLCYTPVVFLALVILIIGAWTIWEDGTTFSVGFSRIMVTTRNTTLDDICKGACLGNDPFPKELMQTRLKFGVLNESEHEQEYVTIEGFQGAGHCAFGVPSELTPIRRGVPYAGLKRRGGKITEKTETD